MKNLNSFFNKSFEPIENLKNTTNKSKILELFETICFNNKTNIQLRMDINYREPKLYCLFENKEFEIENGYQLYQLMIKDRMIDVKEKSIRLDGSHFKYKYVNIGDKEFDEFYALYLDDVNIHFKQYDDLNLYYKEKDLIVVFNEKESWIRTDIKDSYFYEESENKETLIKTLLNSVKTKIDDYENAIQFLKKYKKYSSIINKDIINHFFVNKITDELFKNKKIEIIKNNLYQIRL